MALDGLESAKGASIAARPTLLLLVAADLIHDFDSWVFRVLHFVHDGRSVGIKGRIGSFVGNDDAGFGARTLSLQ